MKKRKIGMTTKAIVLICALLLAANAALGFVLVRRSKTLMKEMINERMLDISNTAAAMLEDYAGSLKEMTAGEENTPAYRAVYDALRLFQDNIDLEYIYTVRDMGNGAFIFLIDPAEENASDFGELVAVTDALKSASLGKSSVDAAPYEDSYGRFYSAYSPVFDKEHRVAAIVAVDFSAEWYDEQLASYTGTVILASIFSLAIGIGVVVGLTARLRSSLRALNSELADLNGDVDKLTSEMGADDKNAAEDGAEKPAEKEETAPDALRTADEMVELSHRIHSVREGLRQYIDKMYAQANSMITALASDYRSVYYVDLDIDEGICYRAHSKLEDGLHEGERFSFHDAFTEYAEQYVKESYREAFLHFIQPGAIRKALENEPIIALRYLVVRNGCESYEMLRMAGVRHPEDRTDHMVHAVGVGFTDVDKETRESMEQSHALSDALNVAEEASSAKTRFLSSMSHEIRTPMNAIIGLDNIALSDPEVPEKTRGYLKKIGDAADHLLGLINDILDMSRIESGRMVLRNEEFSLTKLFEQVNGMIGGQCREKGITYDWWVDEALGEFYIGDATKLRQVIINLLGNAVKFTEKRGHVTFAAERAASFEGNTTLRLRVTDTGIGMDKDFLPHVFDSFSQEDSSTTSKYGSTGLGMAITKSIVEMMNGTVEVESEKNKGTTFTVCVTLIESQRTAAEREGSMQGLSVLIVDDDAVSREHARLALERAGIAAEVVASGKAAVDMARLRSARRESYDLILMDWKMPEMDGVEATRRLRAILGDGPAIVILTAHDWDDVAEEATRAGVDSFIKKPLTWVEALDAFRCALSKNGTHERREEVSLAGRRVLLAEDVDVNAEIMEELLSMKEIRAERAENGRVAVKLFSEHPAGYYDAILMDMRMPEMDGLEAATAIRAMERPDAKTVPIIALTANAFDEDVQRSLQAGLNAHLSKPVEPASLFSTLQELLRGTGKPETNKGNAE